MKRLITVLFLLSLLTGCAKAMQQPVEEITIVKITDGSKEEGFTFATALELIYQDKENQYYLPGLYSSVIIVEYSDGTSEDIKAALEAGRATIADLDLYNISYYSEPVSE